MLESVLFILLLIGLTVVGRFSMSRVLPCLRMVAALWMVGNLSAASLAHRYSFDGDTTDSIGGATGILSEGATIFQGALYTEAGPSQRPAMLIPAGVFPALGTSFSIESWYTPTHPGEEYYFTIFGFGTEPNQAITAVRDRGPFPTALPNYQGLSSLSVTAGTSSITHQTLLPGRQTVLDEQTQFLATYDAPTRTVSLFIDGELVSRQVLVNSTDFDLPALSLNPNFKAGVGGQSPWGDPSLGGSTEDFRLYAGALTDAEVAALYALGADAANDQIMSVIPEPAVILLLLAAGGFGILRQWKRRTDSGDSLCRP
jgi:PEP-CTERM putative exosortase interaction domain